METGEFDREMQRLEEERDRLSDEADSVVIRIIKLVQERLLAWAPVFIENTVKRESETTQKIGLAGVRTLKEGMQAAVDELPRAAKDAFDVDSYWPLRVRNRNSQEETNAFYQVLGTIRGHSRQVPSHLMGALDRAKKPVIDFLKEFGYRAIELTTHPAGVTVLLGDSEFTSKIVDLLFEYSNLHDARWKVIAGLEGTRRRKSESEAGELWDQA